MKILVLDTNAPYANPTPQSFLTELAQRADVVTGGLGITSKRGTSARLNARMAASMPLSVRPGCSASPASGSTGRSCRRT